MEVEEVKNSRETESQRNNKCPTIMFGKSKKSNRNKTKKTDEEDMRQPVPILRGSCSVLGRICKLDKQNEFPLQSTDTVNKDVEGQRQPDSWLPPRPNLSPHRHTPSSKTRRTGSSLNEDGVCNL